MDRPRTSPPAAPRRSPESAGALLRWNVEVMACAQLGAAMADVPSQDPPALADELAAMRRRAALRPTG